MPSKDTKILDFCQYQKLDKAPFITMQTLKVQQNRCKNNGYKSNLESSSTANVSHNIPSGFSMPTISSVRSIENKHDICRGAYCTKNLVNN